MKTLSRVLVVVVFSVMGISLAHYKLKSEVLEIQLKEQGERYELLSSAYKFKTNKSIEADYEKPNRRR